MSKDNGSGIMLISEEQQDSIDALMVDHGQACEAVRFLRSSHFVDQRRLEIGLADLQKAFLMIESAILLPNDPLDPPMRVN